MLKIFKELFQEINERKFFYCSWKNNHTLDQSLIGSGDIDLLVDYVYKSRFKGCLTQHGFIEGKSPISFPYVRHYYGLDKETLKICHIHVYYKLITGESHTKNYHFALEQTLLKNAFLNSYNIKEANLQHQYELYVLRHLIKISCSTGLILYLRERKDYQSELKYIKDSDKKPLQEKTSLLHSIGLNIELPLSPFFLKRLYKGLLLRYRLLVFRRKRFFSSIFDRYKQILDRFVNKYFFKQKKQTSGCIIAFTGLDGSGKSTATETLSYWLNKELTVKKIHVGRPNVTIISSPLRLLLWFRKKRKNSSQHALQDSKQEENNLKFSLRYLALAYERYYLLKKATKWAEKGTIVIADRYPSLTIGKMDSPRIQGDNLFAKLEYKLYQSMSPADLLLQFKVDVNTAIQRNRDRIKKDKETDDEIRTRFEVNKNLQYSAYRHIKIDAEQSMIQVHRQTKECVWEFLININ